MLANATFEAHSARVGSSRIAEKVSVVARFPAFVAGANEI